MVVLASGQVTWAGWRHTATSQPGVVQAGTVGLSGTTVVELHSRQPAGTRTFQSTQSCTAPAPYVECRVVSATLASERLIPGDTVRVVRTLTLGGEGDNLRGQLEIDARDVLQTETSQLSGLAQVSGTVQEPSGSVRTGLLHQIPVDLSAPPAGSGLGTYTAVFDIVTPVGDGAARWDAQLWDQALDLDEVRASFTQVG